MKILILSAIAVLSIAGVDCYIVTVDAHNEECFFVKAEAGTKLGEFLAEKKKMNKIIEKVDLKVYYLKLSTEASWT